VSGGPTVLYLSGSAPSGRWCSLLAASRCAGCGRAAQSLPRIPLDPRAGKEGRAPRPNNSYKTTFACAFYPTVLNEVTFSPRRHGRPPSTSAVLWDGSPTPHGSRPRKTSPHRRRLGGKPHEASWYCGRGSSICSSLNGFRLVEAAWCCRMSALSQATHSRQDFMTAVDGL
jgi:hypothetical protein